MTKVLRSELLDQHLGRCLLAAQGALVVLFAVLTRYADEAEPDATDATNAKSIEAAQNFYPYFQDVHVMIFIGFGFLMTFLRKYGYGAVGFNFLIAVFVLQISILWNGLFRAAWKNDWGRIPLDITALINADFAAGSVLISFGAVLGRIDPMVMLLFAFAETAFYAINEKMVSITYEAADIGGSMVIHTFGAFFGLAASWVLTRGTDGARSIAEKTPSYNSNLFSMIGTIFLFMFWPSFNAAVGLGASKHRAVINTTLAICASTASAFAVSRSFGGRFVMEDIQNATLAGGVAVGASADMYLHPGGAIGIGMLAGVVSVIGYHMISPRLEHKIHLFDTCGVLNLHGMPGVLGGLASIIATAANSKSNYGPRLADVYPAMAPDADPDRSMSTQAKLQLAALGTTLGIALVGGLLTGALARWASGALVPRFNYEDHEYWAVPDDFRPAIDLSKPRLPAASVSQSTDRASPSSDLSDTDDGVRQTRFGQPGSLQPVVVEMQHRESRTQLI